MDSGANVTIVNPSVLNRINGLKHTPIEQVETSSFLPFLGRGHFSICLGGKEVSHDVWVAEVELDGIIGMDFINNHNNCQLTLGQGHCELAQVSTVIPPSCESLIPVFNKLSYSNCPLRHY